MWSWQQHPFGKIIIISPHFTDEKTQVQKWWSNMPVNSQLVNSGTGIQSLADKLQSLRDVMYPKRPSSHFMLRPFEAYGDPWKTCRGGWRFPENVWARSPENWTLSPALSLSHFLKGCDEKILGSSLGTVSLSSAGKHRLQALSVNSCLDALGEFPTLTYFVFNIKLALKIESYDLDLLAGIYIYIYIYIFFFFFPPKEVVRQSL